MSYLRRLARRLTGSAPDNSLRPNVRRWSDGLDPFENWTIAPASIPLTSKRQSEKQIAAPGDKTHPEPKQLGVVTTKKPAQKTELTSRPQRESKPEFTIRQKKSVAPKVFKGQDKATGPEVILESEVEIEDRRSKRLEPLRNRGSIESDNGDARTTTKKEGAKLLGRLRQKASTVRQVRELSPLTVKPGSKRDTVTSADTVPVPMQPAYAKASLGKPVGRKKTATSRAEVPRLVIGNLKVDVVAVDDKPKTRQVAASPSRKKKPIRARDIGRGAAKMKFGLGQM